MTTSALNALSYHSINKASRTSIRTWDYIS